MVHLASLKPGVRASRAELAQEAGCPEQFLAKVMQTLARAQLVVSHRGNTGGFELPEAQRRASLLDVIEAVEGPIHLNLCIDSACGCERKSWCPAHRVWVEAQVAMTGVLRNARLDDLARQVDRTAWM